MRSTIGTLAFGLRLPIIKSGSNIQEIVLNQLKEAKQNNEYVPQNGDIIGITESIVARADSRYCTLQDIKESLSALYPSTDTVYLFNPIFSRNRFSIILRGIAQYFNTVVIIANDIDEVGNEINHKLTGVFYRDFYNDIVEEAGAKCSWVTIDEISSKGYDDITNIIDCTLHPELPGAKLPKTVQDDETKNIYSLKDICNDISKWGLLGSNKVNEETLKLYPDTDSNELVEAIKKDVETEFGIDNVNVMIYGDGCFKDAASGIWEFADPVVSPAYTEGLKGSPYELKLKYLADDKKFDNSSESEIRNDIQQRIKDKKKEQKVDNMDAEGTTPRQYVNLLGSLMDLMSGSGDKGTPVVVVQNYFKNYADD